jgi:hypothetical protein
MQRRDSVCRRVDNWLAMLGRYPLMWSLAFLVEYNQNFVQNWIKIWVIKIYKRAYVCMKI